MLKAYDNVGLVLNDGWVRGSWVGDILGRTKISKFLKYMVGLNYWWMLGPLFGVALHSKANLTHNDLDENA